jgi:hypothetical protein
MWQGSVCGPGGCAGWRSLTKFGHGRQFKIIKWPPTWYGAHALLDTVSRYPQLWRGANADPEDVRSLAELAACLVAYNVSAEGTVTPRSTYRGFETFSFGQKSDRRRWQLHSCSPSYASSMILRCQQPPLTWPRWPAQKAAVAPRCRPPA